MYKLVVDKKAYYYNLGAHLQDTVNDLCKESRANVSLINLAVMAIDLETNELIKCNVSKEVLVDTYIQALEDIKK